MKIPTDALTPWLEPGAGEAASKAVATDAERVTLAAQLSLAITFKRVVDMFEPIVRMAVAEYEAEKAAAKKGK